MIFIRNITIASIIVILVGLYPAITYTSKNQLYSIIVGYFISLLNAIIGYYLNEAALKKSTRSFMNIVFGGMGLRLMFMIIVLILISSLTSLDLMNLALSIFFFYILFTIFEIHFLHKRLLNGKLNLNPTSQ